MQLLGCIPDPFTFSFFHFNFEVELYYLTLAGLELSTAQAGDLPASAS